MPAERKPGYDMPYYDWSPLTSRAPLKWPNDILIAGKKMSGILIETAVRDGGVLYAVLGFGINVNFDPSRTPEIAGLGTSLSKELGKQVSREALLEAILEESGYQE